jgi:hypothetical protein
MGLAKKFKACVLYAAMALALVVAGSASRSWADDLSPKPTRDWAPLMVGGWELSPSLFAGAVYNSNVDQSPTNPHASWGASVRPGFSASLDNGIYKTSLYGAADITNYANSDVTNRTQVNANAGFTQIYRPTLDLVFRFIGNFTRAFDVFGSSAFSTVNTLLPSTPSAPVATTVVSPQVNSNPSNQFTGAVSVDKNFGRWFVGLTATAANTQNSSNAVGMTSTNGTTYTVTERTGFYLTPQIYAFVDPSVNWQRYTDSTLNSNGYRITGGVGIREVGIWRGEIYGGYQAQNNDIVGTYNSPVFGLRIGYSPTPMWEFNALVDETLGAPTATTIGSTAGVATEATTALLNVVYKGLPQDWTTSARFGFVHTVYINSPRIDNGWLAGAMITYEFWRNLRITLDYQYKSVDSNVPLNSFNQHMVTLGALYKY